MQAGVLGHEPVDIQKPDLIAQKPDLIALDMDLPKPVDNSRQDQNPPNQGNRGNNNHNQGYRVYNRNQIPPNREYYNDSNQGYYDAPNPGYYDRGYRNPNHYGPNTPQGDNRSSCNNPYRDVKCPSDITDDVRIISSLLHSHKDDLLSFTLYLQGNHEAMEVEGRKDGDKGKGLQVDTLLDTRALDVDGNNISPKMATKIGKFRKHRVASDEVRSLWFKWSLY